MQYVDVQAGPIDRAYGIAKRPAAHRQPGHHGAHPGAPRRGGRPAAGPADRAGRGAGRRAVTEPAQPLPVAERTFHRLSPLTPVARGAVVLVAVAAPPGTTCFTGRIGTFALILLGAARSPARCTATLLAAHQVLDRRGPSCASTPASSTASPGGSASTGCRASTSCSRSSHGCSASPSCRFDVAGSDREGSLAFLPLAEAHRCSGTCCSTAATTCRGAATRGARRRRTVPRRAPRRSRPARRHAPTSAPSLVSLLLSTETVWLSWRRPGGHLRAHRGVPRWPVAGSGADPGLALALVRRSSSAYYGFTVSRLGGRAPRPPRSTSLSSQTIARARVQGLVVAEPLLWRPLRAGRSSTSRSPATPSDPTAVQASSTLMPVRPGRDRIRWCGTCSAGDDRRPAHAAPRRAGGWRRSPPGRWPVARTRWLVSRRGFWHRRPDVVPQARVQSVRLSQGPLQRRLRLADVHVDSPPGPVRRPDAAPGRRRGPACFEADVDLAGRPSGDAGSSGAPARRVRPGPSLADAAVRRRPSGSRRARPRRSARRPRCRGERRGRSRSGPRVASARSGRVPETPSAAQRLALAQHGAADAGSHRVDGDVGGDVARPVRQHRRPRGRPGRTAASRTAAGPRACGRSRRRSRCRGRPGAPTSAQAPSRVVPTSARVPGSRGVERPPPLGHAARARRDARRRSAACARATPHRSPGRRARPARSPVGVDLDDVAGDVVEPLVGDDQPVDRLGSAGDQAIAAGRRPGGACDLDPEQGRGRGRAACSAVSSSPRPAPTSTTVSRPAPRAAGAAAPRTGARRARRCGSGRPAPCGGRTRRGRTAPRPTPAPRRGGGRRRHGGHAEEVCWSRPRLRADAGRSAVTEPTAAVHPRRAPGPRTPRRAHISKPSGTRSRDWNERR